MTPDNYLVVYAEDRGRIFAIFSEYFGDFVLTKECKGEACGCIGCLLFNTTVGDVTERRPVLDVQRKEVLDRNLVAYAFTREGGVLLLGLKRERYKKYRGKLTKAKLDELFKTPDALLFVKTETDGTFTHSFMSPSFPRRVISKGCKSENCPCVGCRIVDMFRADSSGKPVLVVDREHARATEDGELVLPVYDKEESISKLLNRDPGIRHEFTPNIFGSPLEQIFYELAFLDLHIYPQHAVGKYRLDFAIPDKRIAIELDGHEYHKTKYQRTHDARRDRWLFGQGWHVLRFTGTEIHHNLDQCIDEICQLARVERVTKFQHDS